MALQMKNISHPLHLHHLNVSTLIINRLHLLLHTIALTLIITFRISTIITLLHSKAQPLIPHILIFVSELGLSFFWVLRQYSCMWKPITRTVFPERLPEDHQLPPIDVVICTADPVKEPPLGVMNTVISAMSLNYPPEKLSVYLSDDAGCLGTLEAMREAWKFATMWVPFCKKYGVESICPDAYFAGREVDDEVVVNGDEYRVERARITEEYKSFVRKMIKISESESCISNKDHSAVVEVMVDENTSDQRKIPLLVYVSREKRPTHPHHFKAGALNVLLRVSSSISNSPYILGLDCDMRCNDKNSARQAMCFHLDPKLSSSFAFVQFPQTFHNISEHDIYESELRYFFKTFLQGMDGIEGPCLCGTGYYLKREALYGPPSTLEGINLNELKETFGSSNEFIKSLHNKSNANMICEKAFSDELLQEAKLLASCDYENDTKWGEEVGFRYYTVVEDFLTSFNMHCKHWFSVLCMSSRPSFLGSGTTSFNDVMIQGTRWSAGLIEVALSKSSPLIYGPLRMPILHSFFYTWLASYPFSFLPLWILATIPQLSLLNDITIYPKVISPLFIVFIYVFVSSNLQHIREIHSSGVSLQAWIHEQRMWMMKGITCNLYGSIYAIMEKLGMKEANFIPTNKAINDDEVKLYQMGIHNFQTSSMFLVPLCSLVILNLLAFVVGIVKITLYKEHMIGAILMQTFVALYITFMGYPVLEGMMLRNDKGRILPRVSCYSITFCIIMLSFGKLLVMY